MTSLKRFVLLLVLCVVVVCLLVFLKTTFGGNQPSASAKIKLKVLRRKDQSSITPTQQEVSIWKGQAKEERSLEDKIPKHLPLKIKIKADKEHAFKDVDNPEWAKNFELEVTNTGTKPIYALVLVVRLPETGIDNGKIVFPLNYGRIGFSMYQDVLETAKPEDVPIKPGEIFVFRLNEGNLRAFARFQARLGWPNPTKFLIRFQELNFGDGTGFRSGEGEPWPPEKKAGFVVSEGETPGQNGKRHHATSRKTISAVKATATSSPCATGCDWIKEYNSSTACYATIGCDNIHRADVLPPSEPGKCNRVVWNSQTCIVYQDGYEYEHECPWAETFACSASPAPSPTPTPPPAGGGGGTEGGGSYPYCTDYFWYWFISYDGGHHWEPSGEVDYAGCW